MVVRVADSFEDSVKGKKFRNPETGNEVQFSSLPSGEQSRLRSKFEEKGDEHGEAPAKSWKDRFKGLGEAAKSFMEKAPKAVKQFVEDPEFRKTAVKDAVGALAKAPEKYAKSVLKTVKHEVKEFKEAGAGIKAVLKGGKMDDHQKKAFKTVATHMALGIAAAALTASGPLAAAGAFGKGLVKHVAMKAVSNSLEKVHLMQELQHVSHGLHHVLHLAGEESEEIEDTDGVLMKYVSALVAEELKNLKDEDVEKSLKSMDSEEEE